jgi:RNA polymerase sigma factor (TIGR02999 family)
MKSGDITGLLQRWHDGDKAAESALVERLYPELVVIARTHLRSSRQKMTLRATELVSELYIRLSDQRLPFDNRRHFFAMAGAITRRVLVDLLRAREAEKRGRFVEHVELHPGGDAELLPAGTLLDVLALDEALTVLEQRDAIAAKVVVLRYFGGLNNDEVAAELGVGVATVVRRWQFARAWLLQHL